MVTPRSCSTTFSQTKIRKTGGLLQVNSQHKIINHSRLENWVTKILSRGEWTCEYHGQNSWELVFTLLEDIKIAPHEFTVSFYVVSLITRVPTTETLQLLDTPPPPPSPNSSHRRRSLIFPQMYLRLHAFTSYFDDLVRLSKYTWCFSYRSSFPI